MNSSPALLERAFEPAFLKRLDGLVLGIRRARTFRMGRRALGRVQGSGIELENFRDYSAGDDLRFLDWNAMARLDTLYTKSYRVERETETSILIDCSASMGLPERDQKFGLALSLAAALAYVALGENDPVRLYSFAAPQRKPSFRRTEFLRRRESYASLRPVLEEMSPGGFTALGEVVHDLLNQRRHPGVAIVISDFLLEPDVYKAALGGLLAARYEIVALQVLGEYEATGNLAPGATRLRDSETGEIRDLALTPGVIENFRRRLDALRTELQAFCASRAIAYAVLVGAANLNDFLTRELPRLGIVG